MFELFIAVLLGISFGIVTGLVPGIHVNLVAVILLGAVGVLQEYLSPLGVGVIIGVDVGVGIIIGADVGDCTKI